MALSLGEEVLKFILLGFGFMLPLNCVHKKERVAVPKFVDFSSIKAGKERKERFFTYFAFIVKQENQRILQTRAHLKKLYELTKSAQLLGPADRLFVAEAARKYRVIGQSDQLPQKLNPVFKQLLFRVDKIPERLALVQAAKESGWGTSRFAREAHNFYGQRCYSQGCGLVPLGISSDQKFEVKAFASPADSARSYMHNLNTHSAYKNFRLDRADLRVRGDKITTHALVSHLSKYSEEGEKYTREILAMVESNRKTLDRLL